MAFYSEEVINEVMTRNDIVDVVGSYVKLKKSGVSSYVGLCPFHREKTPSFHVDGDKQLYYCFGCKAGGNVIGFIKSYENLDFLDALKFLADRAGYTLPEAGFEYEKQKELKKRLYEMHKIAARFFYGELNSPLGNTAREYLDKRQISEGARKAFGLGYAPGAAKPLIDELKTHGFTESEMLEGGLVVRKEDGSYRDKFFKRLMFPIIDVFGNVVAFGGRVLDDGLPKYLNSPETAIFTKSKNLYNLNNARKTKKREFILVEGNMDVISIYQAGFKNVVAPMGTAFNERHARILKRYVDSIILLFDSDEAGTKGAVKASGFLTDEGIKVRILQVKDAKDPDEYIKKFGADAFGRLLKTSKNHILFKVEQLKKEADLTDVDQKIDFAKKVTELLAGLDDDIEINAYIPEIVKLTDISADTLKRGISREKNGTGESIVQRVNTVTSRSDAVSEAKKHIINIMVTHPKLYNMIARNISKNELNDEFYARIMAVVEAQSKDGNVPTQASIVSAFEDASEQARLARLFMVSEEFSDDEIKKALRDSIITAKRAYYNDILTNGKEEAEKLKAISEIRALNSLTL